MSLPLEIMSLTAAMGLCDWQEVFELLSEMSKLGLKSTVVTTTTAIAACARGGLWSQALEFFEGLGTRKQVPNQAGRHSAGLAMGAR